MNLKVVPNDENGFWEIHDEFGFLCKLESESTAKNLVEAFNHYPDLVTFVQSAKEAADNCEESLEGLIELRGWLSDRTETILNRIDEESA